MKWLRANEVTPISDTYFKIGGLNEDIDYEFRVAAENRAGLGAYSEVSAPVKTYIHKGQLSARRVIQLVCVIRYDFSGVIYGVPTISFINIQIFRGTSGIPRCVAFYQTNFSLCSRSNKVFAAE